MADKLSISVSPFPTTILLPKGKDHELDYLLLADIFPTSWYYLESAGQVIKDCTSSLKQLGKS